MFYKSKSVSWQANRNNSLFKAELIQRELQHLSVKSILDIGSNAGAVARHMSENNFVVGIDKNLDTRGFEKPFKNVALGEIPFNLENAAKIPDFDAVLLLSVHHQWLAELLEEEADALVKAAISIAKKVVFIEFAALNAKYSFSNKFKDNDENSVTNYAYNYLNRLESQSQITYIGKCPESRREPFRFLFKIEKFK